MTIAIITGSGGLIGAESVRFFSKKFDRIIGIDNDSRKYFFGKLASVKTNISLLKKEIKNYNHKHIDIRNNKIEKIFRNYKKILSLFCTVRHNQVTIGLLKNLSLIFSINALGTLNIFRKYKKILPGCKISTYIHQ